MNTLWPVWAPGICEGPRSGPPPAVVVEADVVCGGGVVLVLVSHVVISHKTESLSGKTLEKSYWWQQFSWVTAHWSQVTLWSAWAGQVSPGSGAARLSLCDEMLCLQTLRPPCPATNCPHLCQPKLVSAQKQEFVIIKSNILLKNLKSWYKNEQKNEKPQKQDASISRQFKANLNVERKLSSQSF